VTKSTIALFVRPSFQEDKGSGKASADASAADLAALPRLQALAASMARTRRRDVGCRCCMECVAGMG
jgi:hypothetical protein